MSEASRSNIPTATGEYTSEDVDILTAALHTPPPATAPSPNIAFHDKIFITIVGPPPALQPSFTQAPSTTPSSSSTTPRAHPSSTSQSRTAQQPDATGTGRSSNQSTSSSATEAAVQPVTSSIQPSQSPDKQPDSAPTPVSASGGLSRGAEAGIVVGILALVAAVQEQHLHQQEQESGAAESHFAAVSAGHVVGESYATGAVHHAKAAACGSRILRGGEVVRAVGQAAAANSLATVAHWQEFKLIQPAAMTGRRVGNHDV
ncbi:hypothetical protein BBAD15_g10196 [Beauveria bassiana D1-5]|uniref:Uncharacterized protein n=1 Tax=Beauveria bassiana D1-5 TaxID=1245745 RepID=A0A0A2VUV6_BEABA|nr:hypothetical protein BBAD15_g10196 [Beauveria bassiana D1-5]